jgi:glycosyltransferase involved in cell wall biosynthesis
MFARGPPMLRAMIRVCHVLASVGEKGGLEKNVIELANRQAFLGHEVSVVADESMRPHFSKNVRFFAHPMASSRHNPLNLRALGARIVSTRAQIVHAHANKAAAMVRGVRRRLGRMKRVATVQNLKRSPRAFRDFDARIAASAQVRESLGGLPATVVWNSIEPPPSGTREAAAATDPPFLGGDEPVFCTVGRLVSAKGIDLLVQAAARVPGFKLWIVGDGKQRGEIESLIAKHKLGERVWLAGHRDDAVGLMGCADLFVVASRNEGGPYTLIEALHMKVPCLSTRVGFAPEFLPADALIQSHSIDELESGLKSVLADPAGFRGRLQPGFELVAREVTLDAMTRKVLRIYSDLIA